ncbi:biotin synthase BioB [Clostridium felsineum]|uniref:Biotin synthase n=1 Tax=Clostridium felsineum TaxID=36839 RepID=A0A1S8LSU1_9CLOT|nr:biotin synthase BioB [Clostridium felsineum]URZ08130.1 Biotin synthase [Clostridium felsineum]URZ13161.1 Biotin synthase [Clostridium felsineum]
MNTLEKLKNKVLSGKMIEKEEALTLVDEKLEDLCSAANEIRKHYCGNTFDICTIINGKSGKCSENCKFCAQSSFYNTDINTYSLLDSEEVLKAAKYSDDKGVLRYSIVTSGKRLSDEEVDKVCDSVRKIKENTNISVCGSFGLLNKEQYAKLRKAGVTRVHNNLETSKSNFKNVCTTHTYEEKIRAINEAKKAGLNLCSGGIMGLSETMEDRIEMAIDIRNLGIRSIPVNMLNPIKGTPYENNKKLTNDDMCRIVAIFRFLVPNASIRLAGGRGLLPDKGRKCFLSGANAVISGDMLTTSGISIETDMKMIKELGFEVGIWNK